MKKLLFILLITALVFLPSLCSAQTVKETKINGLNAVTFLNGKKPTLVFYPGLGEAGTSIARLYIHGPAKYLKSGALVPVGFNVICIQPTYGWVEPAAFLQNHNAISALPEVDPNNIFYTGISAGGHSTLNFITASLTNAAKVKGVILVSSASSSDFINKDLSGFRTISTYGISGATDSHTGPLKSFIDKLTAAGYKTKWVQVTGGHDATVWDTYDPNIKDGGVSVYEWMLSQVSGSVITPPPPTTGGKKIALAPKSYITDNDLTAAVPGDTITLTGTYGDIVLKTARGLTFINKTSQAVINSFTLNPGTRDINLLGNGVPGIKYGIKISTAARFTLFWQATGDCEIAWLDLSGKCGLFMKHCASESAVYGAFPQNFLNADVHDIDVHDTELEGIYAGCDELDLKVLINARIHNVTTRNTGNDGIQCRNGKFIIENNTVINPGARPAFAYDIEGILIGGNTTHSTIRNNTVTGCNGNAIFNDGYGEQIIECNTLESKLSAIYANNNHPTEDLQRVGYFHLVIKNNTLISPQRPIEVNYSSAGVRFTVDYTGNKTITNSAAYVDPGITFNQSGNGAAVIVNCGVAPPPVPVGNDQKSVAFMRNNCGAGFTGSSVIYTIAANKYFAATKDQANNLAMGEANLNGQAYANTNGTCTLTPPAPVTPTIKYTFGFFDKDGVWTVLILLTDGTYRKQ